MKPVPRVISLVDITNAEGGGGSNVSEFQPRHSFDGGISSASPDTSLGGNFLDGESLGLCAVSTS